MHLSKIRTALLGLSLVASLYAGEVPADVRTTSPDGAFQVSVARVGDTNTTRLEIKDKEGNLLFTSPPQIDGTDILHFYPDHLRWNSDSKILAIAAGFPKLFQTYLFAWDGRKFQSIAMPKIASGEDNPWIYPVEWKGNHTLHLTISGPHAGKAHDRGYNGTAVVQVDLETKTSQKISEKVTHDGPTQ
ncbi:hypothetical protein EI77_03966 [Prosthecobacter fusiformis]|uniref:Uncharacterized protein n=1 Tax=Prosthecobacter fusiformis TaxID=48464 RepID=A0A4R7RL89_9BACT|nr:hypothetical protein [Prosthecobacter fusiformis]TDU64516.1 hypothetical protein EI77_03966 [Prosthecobacter fusiformis]